MHRTRLSFVALSLALCLAAGCATGTRGPSGTSTRRDLLTREQMLERHFTTTYDAVQALRGNWLNARGTDSFTNPSEVLVYLDGMRLGGITTLQGIGTQTVQYLRHFNGIDAAARWGLDHGSGVIFVVTEASHPEAFVSPDERLPRVAMPAAFSGPEATNNPSFDWFEYTGADAALGPPAADPTRYHNPILAGFYPDPSIARSGDDYYLVSSSFSYFPGVPIFHSRDLVQWTQIGHILDRPSQLSVDTAGVSRGIFAPTLRYHNGTFYMITTAVDAGGNFVVTATNPAGPWSEPVFLGFDGIDPELFFDDDGRAWILNNGEPDETARYQGHRAIWMQEFDATAMKLTGPRRVVVNGGVDITKNPIWIEAPHIFKVNGWYYLICAEGGTADQHSEVVFRSTSVTGPYTPHAGNPILTQRHLDPARPDPVTSTGHADFVQTPKGDWWAVFLGTRPYRGDYYNTGRETFLLPVRWRDGWPEILAGAETVPFSHAKPALPAQPAPLIPTQGNFTYRDDFSGTTLRRDWQFLRTPRERWYSLTAPAGSLTLRARAASIAERTQPSFVARRQQHLVSTASTVMRYRPLREGDRAGLVAFQNEQFYYLLGVAFVDGRTTIQLEQAIGDSIGGGRSIVASAPLPADADPSVYLRIESRGGTYDFSYALAPGAWITLKSGLDGTALSTKRARGFVGTMFGLYAYTPPR